MADTIPVRAVGPSELERSIDTLALAFSTDPFTRWLIPEAADYLRTFRSVLREFGTPAAKSQTVFVTDDFSGASLWLPPGAEPDEAALQALIEQEIQGERLSQFLEIFEQMGQSHPDEPHWYLPMIGVDPAYQNTGRGAALLRHALARIDREGKLAYLESSNPMNITLYQRHGFEILGEIRVGDSPVMTPMLRRPR